MLSLTKWGLALVTCGTAATVIAYVWMHILSLNPGEGVPIGLGIAIFFALAVIAAGLLLLAIGGLKHWTSDSRQE